MVGISIVESPSRLCVIIGAAFGLCVLPAAGQDSSGQDSSVQESQARDSTVLEEITVYGEIPLTALRGEVYRAEDDYFAAFNELNSRDEFDIRCVWEAPTGTRIKQRVCEAKFVGELRARAFREGVPFASFAPILREKGELLQAEMRTLALERPEIRSALNEFDTAKDRFESERARRCAGRILFCRR